MQESGLRDDEFKNTQEVSISMWSNRFIVSSKCQAMLGKNLAVGRMGYVPVVMATVVMSCSKPILPCRKRPYLFIFIYLFIWLKSVAWIRWFGLRKRPWGWALYKWLTKSAFGAMHMVLYKWTTFAFTNLITLTTRFNTGLQYCSRRSTCCVSSVSFRPIAFNLLLKAIVAFNVLLTAHDYEDVLVNGSNHRIH